MLRMLNVTFSGKGASFCTQAYKTKSYLRVANIEAKDPVDHLIKKFAPRLVYNTLIENKLYRVLYVENRKKRYVSREEPLPVSLKYISDQIQVKDVEEVAEAPTQEPPVDFPFDRTHQIREATVEPRAEQLDVAAEAQSEVQQRFEQQKDMKNWMKAYDNYDDADSDVIDCEVNYGTPDPNSKISKVPCGGCGALLHCKDTAIPGYIPSEIFKKSKLEGGAALSAIICQRCHFLKHYDLALQVQVASEDYPKVLSTISKKRGLVILMVDLLDFPCSVWPGIGEIFGSHVPTVLVGNKVDLLPQDGRRFLANIKKVLLDNVKAQGFATFNIKEVALISAKTGYGVEDLITKLNSVKAKGDVYIVGCTNVGKSSLFNIFLQSDFCKSQASDLIQRATTSVWPGTTLNLLKFPVRRAEGYRQFLRQKRLTQMQKMQHNEANYRKEQLRLTKNPEFATLIGHIGVTKTAPDAEEPSDLFSQSKGNLSGITTMGINDRSKEFIDSKWCYDTPGVVQPDQITHLLTTEELLLTLPKKLIIPRSFCLKPNSTLFIAGLARLDFLEGDTSARFSVFCSNELPITVCELNEAEEIYAELLGSELFKVPTGGSERLAKWPKLEKAKEFNVRGINWNILSNDVVLSSAGWVGIAGREERRYRFQAWTPEKRGVYLRESLLPNAVALSGTRKSSSVEYNKFRFFVR